MKGSFCPTQEKDICSIDCELWRECPVSIFKNLELPKQSQFDIDHHVTCKISTLLPDGIIVKRIIW